VSNVKGRKWGDEDQSLTAWIFKINLFIMTLECVKMPFGFLWKNAEGDGARVDFGSLVFQKNG
jgi:hypothetical protein